jgi:UDP-N-acetylglucosamine 3-dehydrogenase
MTKVGVIGLGKWGINHLRIYKEELSCELIGISDIDKSKERIAIENGIFYFKDYKELLPLVDAVSVVTPTTEHYKTIEDCLNAGKNVYAEKPLTLNHEEAEYLVTLAKNKNLVLNVGYLYRFNAVVKELKNQIKNIGDIHYITARYVQGDKTPRKDSGAIFNLGVHLIDILNFVLEKKPKKIYCKTHNYLSKEREDIAQVLLDYDGFHADLELSNLHPEKKRDMWFHGNKEKIYVDLGEQILIKYFVEISYEEVKRKPEINVQIRKNEPLKESLNNFLQTIKGNMFYNLGEEEIFTTKICELALISAKDGREIIL